MTTLEVLLVLTLISIIGYFGTMALVNAITNGDPFKDEFSAH